MRKKGRDESVARSREVLSPPTGSTAPSCRVVPAPVRHTPGPWVAAEQRYGYDQVIRNVDGDPVAVACLAGYGPQTGKANASLIAAAPELLALLVELKASAYGAAVREEYEDRVEAAIAKVLAVADQRENL